MDWQNGAHADWWRPGDYTQSVVNILVVGKQISLTIDAINEIYEGSEIKSRTHLIGFSLGAHVAGIAGYYQAGNLARITGNILYIGCWPMSRFLYRAVVLHYDS